MSDLTSLKALSPKRGQDASMIVLRQAQDERAWVDRLTAKALAIAEARATRRNHPTRWRRPGWLWPLFAKER